MTKKRIHSIPFWWGCVLCSFIRLLVCMKHAFGRMANCVHTSPNPIHTNTLQKHSVFFIRIFFCHCFLSCGGIFFCPIESFFALAQSMWHLTQLNSTSRWNRNERAVSYSRRLHVFFSPRFTFFYNSIAFFVRSTTTTMPFTCFTFILSANTMKTK